MFGNKKHSDREAEEQNESDNAFAGSAEPEETELSHADFATATTPEPEEIDAPIGVDPDARKPGKKVKPPKPVRKGSLVCFVMMFLIAVSVLAGMILIFKATDLTVMLDVSNIIILIPQMLAYGFVSVPAYAWAARRKHAVKIAYWIAFVVIFGCLIAQLGWYIADIVGHVSAK